MTISGGWQRCTGVRANGAVFRGIWLLLRSGGRRVAGRAPGSQTDRGAGIAARLRRTLQLIPKLLDEGAWPLLTARDGRYDSRLRTSPTLPLTLLEASWLKALLADARIRLFLSDDSFQHLSKELADVEPLYRQEDFLCFDRYLDGDPYADEDYRRRFQAILAAMRERAALSIAYTPPKGRPNNGQYIPLQLEYSAKDDKFRVFAAKVRHGRLRGYFSLNLNRITQIEPSPERYAGPLDVEAWRRSRRCAEPLQILVTDERNGIERFMVEFSSFEKQSEYDADTNACLVKLWYQKDDETEVLIRLLGFGPVVRVLGPARFVRQLRERIDKQMAYLSAGEPQCKD